MKIFAHTIMNYKVNLVYSAADPPGMAIASARKRRRIQNKDGSYETITADFRKYPCIEDSIAEHSAYLLGAKNGSKLRYAGLKGCTDYKKAVQVIKDGGYATSLTYVEKLISIIERWNLTQYEVKDSGGISRCAFPCEGQHHRP